MRECEYYQELISRLLDGDLTAEEETELREHLRVCPDCRKLAAAFSGMTAALRQEDLAEPPADLARGVMERIAAEAEPSARHRNARHSRSRTVRPWVRLTAAACLVLVAAGGAMAVLRGGLAKSAQAGTGAVRAMDGEPAAAQTAEEAPAEGAAGEESAPMTISTQDAGESASAQAAAEDAAPVPAPASPSPSPLPAQPLPVYDAARTRIGTIAPENIPAFLALLADAGWGEDGPPDGDLEYLFKVQFLNRTYSFATDSGGSVLVWWEDPATDPIRSPGTLADLRGLITTETPALPQ